MPGGWKPKREEAPERGLFGCLACGVTWEGERRCWTCGQTVTVVGANAVLMGASWSNPHSVEWDQETP